MKSEVTIKNQSTKVARPLKMLVPLIKEDLQNGEAAAKAASMEYYRAAGEKLIEAKSQLEHGKFGLWVKRNLPVSMRQAAEWMHLARATSGMENGSAIPFSSFRDVVHKTRNNPNYGKPVAWREPVKESIEQAKREAARIQEAQLNQKREHEEMVNLCFRMLDIGYKILSKELHPDKGGSRETMARLNEARKYAKARLS